MIITNAAINLTDVESYFGQPRPRGSAKKLKRGRGTTKQPVFGIFERGGRVYTEIVPDAKKQTLQSVIRGQVALDSIIISDGWRGYNGLVDVGFDKHLRIQKTIDGQTRHVRNGVHINGILTALKASGRSQNGAWPSLMV